MTGATTLTVGQALVYSAAIGAAGTVLSSALAPKPKTPAVAAPTRMPGSAEQDAAKRKSIMEQQQRQGRASTVLTDTSGDALGG